MYRQNLKKEFYTLKARKEGYPARSVYKLKEIDEKFKILKKGDFVLDLGSAPGSWLLYASQKIGDKGKVFGVDIQEINLPQKNNIFFIKKSVLNLTGEDFQKMPSQFQAVVADLAPNTSGIKSVDAARSFELSEAAFIIAKKVLVLGGNFVCKIFEGELTNQLIKEVKQYFKTVKRFKPSAVRKRSKEFYVVGLGFKKNEK